MKFHKISVIIPVILLTLGNLALAEVTTEKAVAPGVNEIKWSSHLAGGVDEKLRATFTPFNNPNANPKRAFKIKTASSVDFNTAVKWDKPTDTPSKIVFSANNVKFNINATKSYPTLFRGDFDRAHGFPGGGYPPGKPLETWLAAGSISIDIHSYFDLYQTVLDASELTDPGVGMKKLDVENPGIEYDPAEWQYLPLKVMYPPAGQTLPLTNTTQVKEVVEFGRQAMHNTLKAKGINILPNNALGGFLVMLPANYPIIRLIR